MQGLLYTGGSQMSSGGTLRFLIALSLQIPPNVADDVIIGVPKSATKNIGKSQPRYRLRAKARRR